MNLFLSAAEEPDPEHVDLREDWKGEEITKV